MRFDTKIAIVVRYELATWQKLNLTAFLASGVAVGVPEVTGGPYQDFSGVRYLSMFRQPVLVFTADADGLREVHRRAVARDLRTAVYPDDLFGTGHDEANRAAVRAVPTEDLRLAGIALYGPRNAVDKATKGLSLHG